MANQVPTGHVFDFAGWLFFTPATNANDARSALAASVYGGKVYNVGPMPVYVDLDSFCESSAYEVVTDDGADTEWENVGAAFKADDWSGNVYQGAIRRRGGVWLAGTSYGADTVGREVEQTFGTRQDAAEYAAAEAESAAERDREEQEVAGAEDDEDREAANGYAYCGNCGMSHDHAPCEPAKAEPLRVSFRSEYGLWRPTFAAHVVTAERQRVVGLLSTARTPDDIRAAILYAFPDAEVSFT